MKVEREQESVSEREKRDFTYFPANSFYLCIRKRLTADKMARALQNIIKAIHDEEEYQNRYHWYKNCYICLRPMERTFTHFALCPECEALNTAKRRQAEIADTSLQGRIAIVTGGRIGIGYATALVLLRKGATVITTTRFPSDALQRYNNEPDCDHWKQNLKVYGIDFRNVVATDRFIGWIHKVAPHVDILINNAAQTIAHSNEYYERLMLADHNAALSLTQSDRMLINSEGISRNDILLPQLPGQTDKSIQPVRERYEVSCDVDEATRHTNSWSEHAQDVSLREMLEVQVVNVTTPFMLVSRLLDMFRQSPFPQRFVINVSAREGCFSKTGKEGLHPHTNMAKASLNMFTQTIAADYAQYGIYVNAVDPGWVSDQAAQNWVDRRIRDGFQCPLTPLDGAARICAPFLDVIYSEENIRPVCGQFLKDYSSKPW